MLEQMERLESTKDPWLWAKSQINDGEPNKYSVSLYSGELSLWKFGGSLEDVNWDQRNFQKLILLCNYRRRKNSQQCRNLHEQEEHLAELDKTKFPSVSCGTLWMTAILWTPVFSPLHFKTPGVDILLEEEKAKVKTKSQKQLCIPGIPKDPAWSWCFPESPWVPRNWAIWTQWSSIRPSVSGTDPLINSGANCPLCIAKCHLYASIWCTTKDTKLRLHSKEEAFLTA